MEKHRLLLRRLEVDPIAAERFVARASLNTSRCTNAAGGSRRAPPQGEAPVHDAPLVRLSKQLDDALGDPHEDLAAESLPSTSKDGAVHVVTRPLPRPDDIITHAVSPAHLCSGLPSSSTSSSTSTSTSNSASASASASTAASAATSTSASTGSSPSLARSPIPQMNGLSMSAFTADAALLFGNIVHSELIGHLLRAHQGSAWALCSSEFLAERAIFEVSAVIICRETVDALHASLGEGNAVVEIIANFYRFPSTFADLRDVLLLPSRTKLKFLGQADGGAPQFVEILERPASVATPSSYDSETEPAHSQQSSSQRSADSIESKAHEAPLSREPLACKDAPRSEIDLRGSSPTQKDSPSLASPAPNPTGSSQCNSLSPAQADQPSRKNQHPPTPHPDAVIENGREGSTSKEESKEEDEEGKRGGAEDREKRKKNEEVMDEKEEDEKEEEEEEEKEEEEDPVDQCSLEDYPPLAVFAEESGEGNQDCTEAPLQTPPFSSEDDVPPSAVHGPEREEPTTDPQSLPPSPEDHPPLAVCSGDPADLDDVEEMMPAAAVLSPTFPSSPEDQPPFAVHEQVFSDVEADVGHAALLKFQNSPDDRPPLAVCGADSSSDNEGSSPGNKASPLRKCAAPRNDPSSWSYSSPKHRPPASSSMPLTSSGNNVDHENKDADSSLSSVGMTVYLSSLVTLTDLETVSGDGSPMPSDDIPLPSSQGLDQEEDLSPSSLALEDEGGINDCEAADSEMRETCLQRPSTPLSAVRLEQHENGSPAEPHHSSEEWCSSIEKADSNPFQRESDPPSARKNPPSAQKNPPPSVSSHFPAAESGDRAHAGPLSSSSESITAPGGPATPSRLVSQAGPRRVVSRIHAPLITTIKFVEPLESLSGDNDQGNHAGAPGDSPSSPSRSIAVSESAAPRLHGASEDFLQAEKAQTPSLADIHAGLASGVAQADTLSSSPVVAPPVGREEVDCGSPPTSNARFVSPNKSSPPSQQLPTVSSSLVMEHSKDAPVSSSPSLGLSDSLQHAFPHNEPQRRLQPRSLSDHSERPRSLGSAAAAAGESLALMQPTFQPRKELQHHPSPGLHFAPTDTAPLQKVARLESAADPDLTIVGVSRRPGANNSQNIFPSAPAAAPSVESSRKSLPLASRTENAEERVICGELILMSKLLSEMTPLPAMLVHVCNKLAAYLCKPRSKKVVQSVLDVATKVFLQDKVFFIAWSCDPSKTSCVELQLLLLVLSNSRDCLERLDHACFMAIQHVIEPAIHVDEICQLFCELVQRVSDCPHLRPAVSISLLAKAMLGSAPSDPRRDSAIVLLIASTLSNYHAETVLAVQCFTAHHISALGRLLTMTDSHEDPKLIFAIGILRLLSLCNKVLDPVFIPAILRLLSSTQDMSLAGQLVTLLFDATSRSASFARALESSEYHVILEIVSHRNLPTSIMLVMLNSAINLAFVDPSSQRFRVVVKLLQNPKHNLKPRLASILKSQVELMSKHPLRFAGQTCVFLRKLLQELPSLAEFLARHFDVVKAVLRCAIDPVGLLALPRTTKLTGLALIARIAKIDPDLVPFSSFCTVILGAAVSHTGDTEIVTYCLTVLRLMLARPDRLEDMPSTRTLSEILTAQWHNPNVVNLVCDVTGLFLRRDGLRLNSGWARLALVIVELHNDIAQRLELALGILLKLVLQEGSPSLPFVSVLETLSSVWGPISESEELQSKFFWLLVFLIRRRLEEVCVAWQSERTYPLLAMQFLLTALVERSPRSLDKDHVSGSDVTLRPPSNGIEVCLSVARSFAHIESSEVEHVVEVSLPDVWTLLYDLMQTGKTASEFGFDVASAILVDKDAKNTSPRLFAEAICHLCESHGIDTSSSPYFVKGVNELAMLMLSLDFALGGCSEVHALDIMRAVRLTFSHPDLRTVLLENSAIDAVLHLLREHRAAREVQATGLQTLVLLLREFDEDISLQACQLGGITSASAALSFHRDCLDVIEPGMEVLLLFAGFERLRPYFSLGVADALESVRGHVEDSGDWSALSRLADLDAVVGEAARIQTSGDIVVTIEEPVGNPLLSIQVEGMDHGVGEESEYFDEEEEWEEEEEDFGEGEESYWMGDERWLPHEQESLPPISSASSLAPAKDAVSTGSKRKRDAESNLKGNGKAAQQRPGKGGHSKRAVPKKVAKLTKQSKTMKRKKVEQVACAEATSSPIEKPLLDEVVIEMRKDVPPPQILLSDSVRRPQEQDSDSLPHVIPPIPSSFK